MTTTKLDGSKIQDAMHYALAACPHGSNDGLESSFIGSAREYSASKYLKMAFSLAAEAFGYSFTAGANALPRDLSAAPRLVAEIAKRARAYGIDAYTGEPLCFTCRAYPRDTACGGQCYSCADKAKQAAAAKAAERKEHAARLAFRRAARNACDAPSGLWVDVVAGDAAPSLQGEEGGYCNMSHPTGHGYERSTRRVVVGADWKPATLDERAGGAALLDAFVETTEHPMTGVRCGDLTCDSGGVWRAEVCTCGHPGCAKCRDQRRAAKSKLVNLPARLLPGEREIFEGRVATFHRINARDERRSAERQARWAEADREAVVAAARVWQDKYPRPDTDEESPNYCPELAKLWDAVEAFNEA